MRQPKYNMAASIHAYFGLVITGGHDYNGYVNTVESTKDGRRFSILPPMPTTNTGHCQVTVDLDTIMVFGGANNDHKQFTDVAFKLDVAERKWSVLPKLPTGRQGPACGVIREKDLPKRVVVSGGKVPGGTTNNVEVLDLASLKWTSGNLQGYFIPKLS